MPRRKKKVPELALEKVANYVMFGFSRDDIDVVGYLGKRDEDGKEVFAVVDDMEDAVLFPEKNVENVKGFGTPQQWLEYWNSDETLNFKFHLVKTNR